MFTFVYLSRFRHQLNTPIRKKRCISGIHTCGRDLGIEEKCEWVARWSFIAAAVHRQLKGLPLIFIHCPSICPTIEHQSKFYNTQSQINPNLQYRQTSALYKSLSLIFIHYPLANTQWHPTDYKTERLKPSTQFCSLSVYMCVFPFRRMLFQCPLI